VQFHVTIPGVQVTVPVFQLVKHGHRSSQDILSTGTLEVGFAFNRKKKFLSEFEWEELLLITQGSSEFLVSGGLPSWSFKFSTMVHGHACFSKV